MNNNDIEVLEDVSNETNLNIEEKKIDNQINKEPKKKKKKGPIIVVILLVLCLALGTGSWYFFFNKPPKSKETKVKKKEVQSKYRITSNSLTNFDLAFLKIENKDQNKVYSPLSIKYALEMLSEGASGTTKSQVDSVIGEYKANKYTNSANLSLANAMFIKDSYKDNVKKTYTDKLKNNYNADIIYDNFENATNINNWVGDKTLKLINNLYSDNDIQAKKYMLLNALAIDMNWNNQIDCIAGSLDKVPCLKNAYGSEGYDVVYKHEKISDEDEEYHAANHVYFTEEDFPGITFNNDKKVKTGRILADFNRYDAVKEIGEEKIRSEVGPAYREWLKSEDAESLGDYVIKDVDKYLDTYIAELNKNYNTEVSSTDFMLYADEDVKAFAKDLKEYDGTTLQYVGIMPKNDNLGDYIKSSNADSIKKIIDNLKELKKENFKDGVATIITGNIPFFKFDYELELKKDLQELGIKDVFDAKKSDLSNAFSDENASIDDAKHKANIEFSNEGIKASAATAVEGGATSGPQFNYLYKIPVEKIDITFDKPYLFLIRNKETGEVWFTGTVYDPVKYEGYNY